MSSSLGNLAVKVDADIAPLSSNFDKAAQVAKSGMGAASGSVDEFRASLMRASLDMQRAAQEIGNSMGAANDAIIADAKQSSDAIKGISDTANSTDFKSMGEKIGEGIREGINSGMDGAESAYDKFVDDTKAKALIIGIAVGAIFAAVGLGAIYTAFKLVSATIGTIVGLFNGDTYKSENVDALIEANKQVKDLQASLQLTAEQASATGAALATMGVDSKDYVKTFTDAADAIRSNKDELDRLGVKYKDAKGNLLPLQEVISNANDVLNQYTEGWDRNHAAMAIGLGSSASVAAAASVTGQKIEEARDRLNAYNLGIGPETQEAVKQYQDAMQAFNRESDLTSQGFKRAIADNMMPLLTDLAEFFRDGFPSAVAVFRDVLAGLMTLFYGLKTAIYAVAESILGAIESIGMGIGGLGSAAVKAMQGDFSGAKDDLVKGWSDAKDRLALIGDNIVAQHQHNAAAVRLAWAKDDRAAGNLSKPVTGKKFTPAPDDDERGTKDPFLADMANLGRTQAGLEFVIANFDKFLGKVKESKAAMAEFDVTLGKYSDEQRKQQDFQPLTAEQKAAYIAKSQLIDDDLHKERQLQTLRKFDNSTQQFGFKEQQALDSRKQDIEWMGKGQVELAKLTEARRIDGEVAALINQTQIELGKSGLTITEKQIDAIHAKADAAKMAQLDLIQKADDKAKDPWFNASESIRKYGEEAANTGLQIGNALSGAFKNAEDSLVSFAMTGKISFSNMATSIEADLVRMSIKGAESGFMSFLMNSASSYFAGNTGAAASTASAMPGDSLDNLMNLTNGFGTAARRKDGGLIVGPGTGTSDSIPLWGSNGEFMMNHVATQKNRALLEYLNGGGVAANAPRFATGGMIGSGSSYVAPSLGSGSVNVNITNAPADSSASVKKNRDGNGGMTIDIMFDQMEKRLAKNVNTGKGDLSKSLAGRYGLKPNLR